MTRGIWRVVWAALLMLFASGITAAGGDPDAGRRFMTAVFDLTPADLKLLDTGGVISRTLPVKDSREMATFGVVRIKITADFYVQQFSDIARFKQADAIAQIGAFNNPATPADIEALTLDESDLKSLSSCRIGDCRLQLPAEAIQRFNKELDWRQPDAQKRATGLLQQVFVNYVTEYQRNGARTAMRYADTKEVLDLEREFTLLLDSTPATWQHFPTLRRHLLDYPATHDAGSTDLVYWSKEKMGRKPVVSVTHLAIVPGEMDFPWAYAIASKHIYGSHYIDASLGLTVLVPDLSSDSPATYVIYVNRSRVDVFGGMFGGLVRKIVTSRARQTMDDQFARLQQRLEAQFAAVQTTDAR
jgi:hypothetical protein